MKIEIQDDSNVLEKDKDGLRAILTEETLLTEYQTEDGIITGTDLKKIVETETSVLELQTKSDSYASEIASLQTLKTELDILIAECRAKTDEAISKRTIEIIE